MSIDRTQLSKLIGRVLRGLDLYSESAVNLLLGTAAQESASGTYLRQLGDGPALGICQMEPATESDIWQNYLRYRGDLSAKVTRVTGHTGPGPWLEWDLAYQLAMARIHYYRIPDPLPAADNIPALAAYWKLHYNTPSGSGKATEFVANYHRYLAA